MNQGEYYNKAYKELESHVDERGLPDWKITGYKKIKDKKILSIGCGIGLDIWYLTDKNEVYGIDISEKAAKIARRHGIKARVGDCQKRLPYKDKFFDIVILKDILEHLVDPLSTLKEARKVLKNGGYIVVDLPNHLFLWFRLRLLFGKNLIWKGLVHDCTKIFDEWNYMHLRFFTYKGVLKFLKTAGFRPKKFFWDFGTLGHCHDPEMYYPILKTKKKKSPQAKLFLTLYPFYKIFNFFFPRKLRVFIVGLKPGLLCAEFYFWAEKDKTWTGNG